MSYKVFTDLGYMLEGSRVNMRHGPFPKTVKSKRLKERKIKGVYAYYQMPIVYVQNIYLSGWKTFVST